MNWLRTAGLFAILTLLLSGISSPTRAAVNAATGGVGGIDNGTMVGGDGTGEARIELFSTRLALNKQARDLTGSVLPGGSAVSPGQELYFVLYVDNVTAFPANDLRLSDTLDELRFTYVAGSLERTVVVSGSDDSAIWAGSWTSLTDPTGLPDDQASATDSGGAVGIDRITVGADPSQPNQTLDLGPNSLTAIRFRVRVN